MAEVRKLSVVAPDAEEKANLLDMIDDLRQMAESGEIVALLALPVKANREWQTRHAGTIKTLEMIGMIACAQTDLIHRTDA